MLKDFDDGDAGDLADGSEVAEPPAAVISSVGDPTLDPSQIAYGSQSFLASAPDAPFAIGDLSQFDDFSNAGPYGFSEDDPSLRSVLTGNLLQRPQSSPTPSLEKFVPQSFLPGGTAATIVPRLSAPNDPNGRGGPTIVTTLASSSPDFGASPVNEDDKVVPVVAQYRATSSLIRDPNLVIDKDEGIEPSKLADVSQAQGAQHGLQPGRFDSTVQSATNAPTPQATGTGRISLQELDDMLTSGNPANLGVTPELANALADLRRSVASNSIDQSTVSRVLSMDLSGVAPDLQSKLRALGAYVSQFGPGAQSVQVSVHAVPGFDQTGRFSWRAGNDEAFLQAVNQFNTLHGLHPGDQEYGSADRLKAQSMIEAGGERNRIAFMTDPLQVNNPGDWDPKKADQTALTGPHETMTPFLSAYAGLQWMHYKRFDHDQSGAVVSSKDDWHTLHDYNGNKVKDRPGWPDHRSWYADTAISLGNSMSQDQ